MERVDFAFERSFPDELLSLLGAVVVGTSRFGVVGSEKGAGEGGAGRGVGIGEDDIEITGDGAEISGAGSGPSLEAIPEDYNS